MIGGASANWAAGNYWERYEQFREPDIDYGTRNTIYRSVFKTSATIIQFGLLVVLGNLFGFTIPLQALASPPSMVAVASAVILGLVLAGGMLAVAASLETNGSSDSSPLAPVLLAQSPLLIFGGYLILAPVAAIYFAGSWVVGRLGGLLIAYLSSS